MIPFDNKRSHTATIINPFQQDTSKAQQSENATHSYPPRKIEIYRKTKLFASMNIEDILLTQFQIDYRKYDINLDHSTGKKTILDLNIFDNTDYEIHSAKEWIQLGTKKTKDGTEYCRIPAKALKFR